MNTNKLSLPAFEDPLTQTTKTTHINHNK